jgi:hypothetical protein
VRCKSASGGGVLNASAGFQKPGELSRRSYSFAVLHDFEHEIGTAIYVLGTAAQKSSTCVLPRRHRESTKSIKMPGSDAALA